MCSRHALWPSEQASQLLPRPLAPVTSRLRRSAIQSQAASLRKRARSNPRTLIIDVLDAGRMAQAGDPGTRFELLLPAQRQFIFEEQAKPFGVIEVARFGFVLVLPEPLGQVVKAESVRLVEFRMSEHADV